jgi:hypothetical protein
MWVRGPGGQFLEGDRSPDNFFIFTGNFQFPLAVRLESVFNEIGGWWGPILMAVQSLETVYTEG